MANVYENYSELKSVPNVLNGGWTTTTTPYGGINSISATTDGNTLHENMDEVLKSIKKKLVLVNPCPPDATPIDKQVYPFRESIVFKHNMKYYFKKIEVNHDDTMKLINDYEELQVAGNPSGLQIEGLIPEQFIVATMDYLETISPDADNEHKEAMKHLKFALAYLEKSSMEKVKQAALKNKE